MGQKAILIVVTYVLACAAFSAEALGYTYTEIIVPGLTGATAAAINNRGDIVGYGAASSGTVGFLESKGAFTLLSFPGSASTVANGINDAGDIVGGYTDTAAGRHGFLYSEGAWTTIDAPAPELPNTTTLRAINNLGQIAGATQSGDPSHGLRSGNAFIYHAGTFSIIQAGVLDGISLTGLNDSGEYVGSYGGIELPGWPIFGHGIKSSLNSSLINGYFTGINDGGQVIFIRSSASYLQASSAQTTTGNPIVFPGAPNTTALGINNTGNVVGFWIDAAGQQHAFQAVTSAPACIVSTSSGPPAQMSFSVQDTSGLAQIAVSNAINASANVPTFVAGTTGPILVTSGGTNPAHTASVTLTATNASGVPSTCSASIAGTGPAQWQGLGGILITNMGLASAPDGSLDAWGLGSDTSTWHISQIAPGGPWGSWTGPGGAALASRPTVMTDSAGQLEILGISADGYLWQISQTAPGTWSGAVWHTIAPGVKGQPALIQNANKQLQAFVRAADDSVVSLTQSAPGSSAWAAVSLGGVIISNPAAILAFGNAEVVAIGTDGALWNTSVNQSGQVNPWTSIGGSLKGDPSLIISVGGNPNVFARGADDSVWYNDNLNPAAWQSLGGVIVNNPSGILNSDGRLEVFAAGTDNAVWHRAQIIDVGTQWSDWSSLGGVIIGDAVPAVDASGAANLFVRGSDSALWYLTQLSAGFWQ
jgi:probable HAF family extracellular repeat protein